MKEDIGARYLNEEVKILLEKIASEHGILIKSVHAEWERYFTGALEEQEAASKDVQVEYTLL